MRIHSSPGFTLLEVTIALAVLAVAFTALSSLQARNLTLTAEDRLLTESTLAARDLLAQMQSGLLPVENGEGEMGADHPGWRWMVRVRNLDVKGLYGAEIIVFPVQSTPEKGAAYWLIVYKEPEP